MSKIISGASLSLALFVGIVLACSSNPALADQTITASRPTHVSFEVQPIGLLINLVPGSNALNGSVEIPLGQHLAAVGTASMMKINLPDSTIEKMRDDSDADQPIIKSSRSNMISGGARYYGNTSADSWYLGAQFGVGTNDMTWVRSDGDVEDKNAVYTSGFDAGYRWLWNSGFLIRVGGGVNAVNQRERTLTAVNTNLAGASFDDVEKKGQTQKTVINTALNFGMGWAF